LAGGRGFVHKLVVLVSALFGDETSMEHKCLSRPVKICLHAVRTRQKRKPVFFLEIDYDNTMGCFMCNPATSLRSYVSLFLVCQIVTQSWSSIVKSGVSLVAAHLFNYFSDTILWFTVHKRQSGQGIPSAINCTFRLLFRGIPDHTNSIPTSITQ